MDKVEWSEDSTADGDGVIEGGEEAQVRVRLKNESDVAISKVNATLVCTRPGVEVVDATTYYYDIPTDGKDFGGNGFGVDFNIPSDQNVEFTLNLEYRINNEWYFQSETLHGSVMFPGEHGQFSIPEIIIDDSPSIAPQNNGDGKADSGERVYIRPQLRFDGAGLADDPLVTLIYPGSDLTVSSNTERYPDLSPGAEAYPDGDDYFRIDVGKSSSGPITLDALVERDGDSEPLMIEGAFTLDVQPTPWLHLGQESWDFGVVEPGKDVTHRVTVTNPGSATLNVTSVTLTDQAGNTVTDTAVSPAAFELSPGESRDIEVTIHTTSISNGTSIERRVHFLSNGRTSDPSSDEQLVITGLVSRELPVFELPTIGAASRPDISGSWAVWSENRFGNSDIFAFNMATQEQIQVTSDPSSQTDPRISGTLIVWEDLRNGDSDHKDIYAFDLITRQEFVVSDDPSGEELVGVDGDRVAFRRSYHAFTEMSDMDDAWNLWIYSHANGSTTKLTGFSTNGSHQTMGSVYYDGDFGGGTVAWEQTSLVWAGTYWERRGTKLMKYRFDHDQAPVAVYNDNASEVAVDGESILWSDDDANRDEQVYLWRNGVLRKITPVGSQEEYDHGDDVLAIGGTLLAYDKKDSVTGLDNGPFVFDVTSGKELLVSAATGRPSDGRMDGNGLVWKSSDSGQLFVALLKTPDLSLSNLTFDNANPQAGELFNVSATVRNTSEYDFGHNVIVRLYDGDPDTGGLQLGDDQVITGGLASGAETTLQFSVNAPDASGSLSPQMHNVHARLYLDSGYDNPGNNTTESELLVGMIDVDGPTISKVTVGEQSGDGDGVIGTDEQSVISLTVADASGIASIELVVDQTHVNIPVDEHPTTFDHDQALDLLDAGTHSLVIRATDSLGNVSEHHTTFDVVPAEEITILLADGTVLQDGQATAIDFGTVQQGQELASRGFTIRNDGQQELILKEINVPRAFSVTGPASTALAPGESTFFLLTLASETSGVFDGQVSLLNSDGPNSPDGRDESSFDFPIRGEVVPSQIGQQLVSGPATVSAPAGQPIRFAVQYDTSTADNTLTGLGLRIHFDSSCLSFEELTGVLPAGYISQQGPLDDDADFDNDATTDQFVLVAWSDPFSGNWPNEALPAELFEARFSFADGLEVGTTASVNFSASSTAADYGFAGQSVTAIVAPPFNLDVDGNGSADALTDGLLIMRGLFGFTDAALTSGAIDPAGTRTSPAEISQYLQDARTVMLDVDGNGTADALTDGVQILRFLFGFSGEQLVKDAIGANATRTDPAEVAKFLATFLPQAGSGSTAFSGNNNGAAITLNAASMLDDRELEKGEGEAASDTQFVSSVLQNGVVSQGQEVKFDVLYTTLPENQMATGLGLRMHFDSTALTFGELSKVLDTNLVAQQAPQPDVLDYDNDPKTDQFVLIAWSDPFGAGWPKAEPTVLYAASFTAGADFTGSTAVHFTASSNAAGFEFGSTAAEIEVSPAAPSADLAHIRLETTNLDGQPIITIAEGQEFLLRGFVEDLRPQAAGVFAAYTDVTFDPDLVEAASEITFGARFPNVHSGSLLSQGLIDEVGAAAEITPTGTERLLFSLRMTGSKAGQAFFATDPADILPQHDTLLYGQDEPVQVSDIVYGTAVLEIVPRVSAMDDDEVGDEDNPIVLPVLANDVGDQLTVSEFNALSLHGASITNNGDGILRYDPHLSAELQSLAPGQSILDSFTYTVVDSHGTTDTATVTLEIHGVNDAPTVQNSIADLTIPIQAEFTWTLPENIFVDPENDALLYAANVADGSAFPSWLTFDANTATFTGVPSPFDVGVIQIAVTATDDGEAGLNTEAFFTLTVQNPFHNAVNGWDVNNDAIITLADALAVINDLNSNGARLLPIPQGQSKIAKFLDVNGDGFCTPIDALRVINRLNVWAAGQFASTPEGESSLVSTTVDVDTLAAVADGGMPNFTHESLDNNAPIATLGTTEETPDSDLIQPPLVREETNLWNDATDYLGQNSDLDEILSGVASDVLSGWSA